MSRKPSAAEGIRSLSNKRGLRELAKKLGYAPGKFAIVRHLEAIQELETWKGYLDSGVVPDDLMNLSLSEAKAVYRKEAADIEAQEWKHMKFFYPELRASEDSVDVKGELTVNVVKFSPDKE